MVDRRKIKRRHLIYYLRIFDRDSGELLGHLVDISTGGMMIISEQPLETRKRFRLRMVFPEKLLGKENFDFEARSLWCKPDLNPSFYDIGFSIENLSPEVIQTIEQLITEYGFND